MVGFLENWLSQEVAPQGLSTFFALQRGHRVPARPPLPGAKPRLVLARLLHYLDRDFILQRSRVAVRFHNENTTVAIFPTTQWKCNVN